MSKFKYIFDDGLSWNHSAYFAYLDKICSSMPPQLSAFACEVERYELRGSRTLHDCRVLSLSVKKNYTNPYRKCSTSLVLELVDQFFEKRISLRYDDATVITISDNADSHNNAVDILLHEFLVLEDGQFEHYLVLDNEGEIRVRFRDFECEWDQPL